MGGNTKKQKNRKEQKNIISWFEIPAINFQQSVNFYNHIFGIEMETNIGDSYAMAFFP